MLHFGRRPLTDFSPPSGGSAPTGVDALLHLMRFCVVARSLFAVAHAFRTILQVAPPRDGLDSRTHPRSRVPKERLHVLDSEALGGANYGRGDDEPHLSTTTMAPVG